MRLRTWHWICDSCRDKAAHQQIRQCRKASSSTNSRLPQSPARTRFAPSPTGNLHLGSIRTALFNYLLARRTKGQFILRIEDTDQKRTIPGTESKLCKDLRWAGIEWDEGPDIGGEKGPYRQSERVEIYQRHVKPLLDTGHAYRCFCSSERINDLNRSRNEAGLLLGYNRRCAGLSREMSDEQAAAGKAHVIRFRIPDQYPKYDDFVYGKSGHGTTKGHKQHIDHPVYDDPILVKSDGFPTYHFANIVDDHLMQITHVIRGSEWMSSTPLHIAMYNAFGWQPPKIGHVPLLVDERGQKLSKRNLDTDIASFRDKLGIFPETLANFAVLLGWSHQRKNDVMNMDELQDVFDLKFTKGNTIVSFEKLEFLQQHHARRRIQADGSSRREIVIAAGASIVETFGAAKVISIIGTRRLEDVIAMILRADSKAYSTPEKFAQRSSVFFEPLKHQLPFQHSGTFPVRDFRTAAATMLLVPEAQWYAEIHRSNLAYLLEAQSEGDPVIAKRWNADFYHYLRWGLLGSMPGPSMPESMEILGRTLCVERLQSAAQEIVTQENMQEKPKIIVNKNVQ